MRQRFAIICKAGEVFFGELDADRALSRAVGWLKLRRDSRTIAEPERVDSEIPTYRDLSRQSGAVDEIWAKTMADPTQQPYT